MGIAGEVGIAGAFDPRGFRFPALNGDAHAHIGPGASLPVRAVVIFISSLTGATSVGVGAVTSGPAAGFTHPSTSFAMSSSPFVIRDLVDSTVTRIRRPSLLPPR